MRTSFSAGTRMANVVTPPIAATCMPTPIRNVTVSVADPVPDLHPPTVTYDVKSITLNYTCYGDGSDIVLVCSNSLLRRCSLRVRPHSIASCVQN